MFVIVGGLALAYLSVQLGGMSVLQSPSARFTARFSSVGSLKPGDPVKIAGVSVGSVESVQLVNYQAEASFALTTPVAIPKDSIASIQSAGLLGDAYVSISPGASEDDLASGERIVRTEPAVSLTELIAKYAFGSPTDPADDDTKKPETPSDNGASPSPFVDPLAPEPSASAGEAPSASSGAASAEPAKKSVFKDPLE
jgi:phospholipid/cholesterol/gamma-HCH transport system substrate-binding protein